MISEYGMRASADKFAADYGEARLTNRVLALIFFQPRCARGGRYLPSDFVATCFGSMKLNVIQKVVMAQPMQSHLLVRK